MYYVTKYALTRGILAVKDDEAEESNGYLYVGQRGHMRTQIGKRDWFRDRAEAMARVQDMVDARLRSLDRSLAALKKLDITRMQDWNS